METFEQWVVDQHPDVIDENWKHWLAGGALGAAAALGGASMMNRSTPLTPAQKAQADAKRSSAQLDTDITMMDLDAKMAQAKRDAQVRASNRVVSRLGTPTTQGER